MRCATSLRGPRPSSVADSSPAKPPCAMRQKPATYLQRSTHGNGREVASCVHGPSMACLIGELTGTARTRVCVVGYGDFYGAESRKRATRKCADGDGKKLRSPLARAGAARAAARPAAARRARTPHSSLGALGWRLEGAGGVGRRHGDRLDRVKNHPQK